MAIEEDKLPSVMPASVPRVTKDGLPTKFLVDWEETTRDWYRVNAVASDKRLTEVESTVTDPVTGLEATAKVTDDLSTAVGLDTSGPIATASKITTVETAVGEATAGGAVGMYAETAYPSTGRVAYSWYIKASAHPSGANSFAGMTAVADTSGTGSAIVFLTNTFQLYDPGDTANPKQVFSYSGGLFSFTGNVSIDGNLVVNGTIVGSKIGTSAVSTSKIAPNSVTNVGYGQSSAPGNSASCAVQANDGDAIIALVAYSQTNEVMDAPGTTAIRNVTCDGGQTTPIAIPMLMTHADLASDNTVSHQYFLRAPTTRPILFTASGNGSHVISAAGLANCDIFIQATALSR